MTDISLALLRRYPNKIVWNLNQLCNFRCEYCFFPQEVLKREHDAVGRYSVDHIVESFDSTGREWLVMISGGEPFLYRELVPLAEKLTKNHHLQLTTNLSRPAVHEFGKRIDPSRVMIICASIHMNEVERRGEKWLKDFVERYLFLRERGFRTIASYVTYPPLFDRIEDDFEMLRSHGIDNLTTLTFRGMYGERMYPDAYTDEQRQLIIDLSVDKQLETAVAQGLRYLGKPCDAGENYFQMSPDGSLHRCCSVPDDHGNLFEGTARFNGSPLPCSAELCQDACMGVVATHDELTWAPEAPGMQSTGSPSRGDR